MLLVLSTSMMSCHRSTVDEQCAEMIKREKRRLPRNIARGVVLDSMKYETHKKTVVFYYTLCDSLFSDESIAQGRSQMESQLLDEIANSVALRRLKDNGVSFKYVYLGDAKQERLVLNFENKYLH